MSLKPPRTDSIQASNRRIQRHAAQEEERKAAFRSRFRWVIWGLAVVLLMALMTDIRNLSSRLETFQKTGRESRRGDAADLAAGFQDERFTDPVGRFSLVPPRNWVRVAKPVDGFFDTVFQGPYGMDMSIQVVVTNGLTFEKLIDRLRRVERTLSADTHMDVAYVGPYRAVKRSAQLYRSKVLMLDFVTGDLAHHIQFSVPTDLYDEYEPIFLRLMQTYEPGRILRIAPPAP
ncbi:MAG: hypothetical protein LBN38_07905 [Verrucomicrobiota bacterium]|jgi:hypothetical protein|nr:hypothetical protein [Verrucomicrobiota bacterium]